MNKADIPVIIFEDAFGVSHTRIREDAILRAAAQILQDRAEKPRGLLSRVLVGLLRAVAEDIEAGR